MRQALGALLAALATLAIITAHPALAGECDAVVNLKAAAERTGALKEMMRATHLAGLDNPEVDVGPLTLLAPTDAAFNALPEAFRVKLLAPENREHLVSVLLHHAIPGEFPTERLLAARVRARHYAIGAIDGSEVEITLGRGIDVAGASIVKGDIRATDGIIHLIDKVLIPPSVIAALGETDGTTKITAIDDAAEAAE